jgi:hypothetical protein
VYYVCIYACLCVHVHMYSVYSPYIPYSTQICTSHLTFVVFLPFSRSPLLSALFSLPPLPSNVCIRNSNEDIRNLSYSIFTYYLILKYYHVTSNNICDWVTIYQSHASCKLIGKVKPNQMIVRHHWLTTICFTSDWPMSSNLFFPL